MEPSRLELAATLYNDSKTVKAIVDLLEDQIDEDWTISVGRVRRVVYAKPLREAILNAVNEVYDKIQRQIEEI